VTQPPSRGGVDGRAIVARLAYGDHLVAVLLAAEAAATRLADADPDRRARVVARARRESARLSARLDGSPLEPATADAIDRGRIPAAEEALTGVGDGSGVAGPASGGWARVLKLDGMTSQEVAAVEYANLLACFDVEPVLARTVFERPLQALAVLHGTLVRGLVAPEVVARPRRTAQAVHDGAQGRVLYNAPDPDAVPSLLARLEAWLRGGDVGSPAGARGSAGLPAIVVAGVVHERLLEWQPFEAANGRLARAAARLVLRARGVDPHGAAVPERLLAADPLGYYGEVAATLHRRGDLSLWLERYAEAVAVGLAEAAAAVAAHPPPPPAPRALEVCAGLPVGGTLTLAEYRQLTGVGAETAALDLRSLTGAGLLRLEPRTRGLRYRRTPGPARSA
jgi:hypothetical protein